MSFVFFSFVPTFKLRSDVDNMYFTQQETLRRVEPQKKTKELKDHKNITIGRTQWLQKYMFPPRFEPMKPLTPATMYSTMLNFSASTTINPTQKITTTCFHPTNIFTFLHFLLRKLRISYTDMALDTRTHMRTEPHTHTECPLCFFLSYPHLNSGLTKTICILHNRKHYV